MSRERLGRCAREFGAIMKKQTRVATLTTVALVAALCVVVPRPANAQSGVRTQKPETLRLVNADTLRGKQLLEAGDAVEAEKVLREATARNVRDSTAWHYLGLALARQNKTKEARDALVHAVDIRNTEFGLEFNLQRRNDAELSKEESDARRLRFTDVTKELIESIESFVAVAHEYEEFWGEWLATLKLYEQLAADTKFDTAPFNLARLATRAVITYKAEPGYTEDARRHHVSGNIKLRAMLGADGTVKGISVIKDLPHGLTEKSIEAARKTIFTPATIDGRPVSQLIVLEYNFNTY
jgi:tetratricopeptide (TPR) repeat protein